MMSKQLRNIKAIQISNNTLLNNPRTKKKWNLKKIWNKMIFKPWDIGKSVPTGKFIILNVFARKNLG